MSALERKICFNVGFNGSTYHRSFKSKSTQWEKIQAHWPSTHSAILPDYQFAEDQVMQDQVRAHIRSSWVNNAHPITWKEEPPSGEAGIAIILESPHDDEYDPVTRAPVAPLNNIDSRCKFLRRLGEIINCIAEQGVTIPEGDVVLCNPVPYQASLARLYRNPEPYPLNEITKEVWQSIYSISDIKADFRRRLVCRHRPELIINACTSRLQKRVHTTLRALVSSGWLDARLVRVYHPAKWGYRQQTLGSIRVDDPIRRRNFS